MNISGTDRPRCAHGRLARAVFSVLVCFLAPSAWADDPADPLAVKGSATLGTDLYVIENPFDNANVTGFFDQYRYIRDKGAELPFFLDLTHFNLGLVREDNTYLLRVERWSRNAINANTLFNLGWKGLIVEGEIRRYRSDALRFFPQGTEDDWTGVPQGLGFGTTYNPGVPGLISNNTTDIDAIFGGNYRIGIERFDFQSEIALRPDGFGYDNRVLKEARLRAGYGSRTGHRQDSFLLDLNESLDPTSRFRGNRRAVDQTVTNGGTGFVFALGETIAANLAFDIEKFVEDADVVTLEDLVAGSGGGLMPTNTAPETLAREFFFVPDTNRYSGSLQLTRRGERSLVNAGVFATHLEQTGRLSNLQTRYSLGLNNVTTVSAHLDGAVPLADRLELSGFLKYIYRANNIDEDAFTALDLPGGGQESPYIRKRNEVRGSAEIALRPMASTRIALGYGLDWVDRELAYPQGGAGVQPDVSVIHPRSSSHRVFLKGRTRLFRSLQLAGELGRLWAPEVAYPNDLSEATSFRGRGSYSLGRRMPGLPLTLSFAGRVVDGKNDDFDLPGPGPVSNGSRRAKNFERTDWGYDITLTALPHALVALYSTFSQSADEQSSDYVRTTLARSAGGGAFYVDSIPHYESDIKSLTVGGNMTNPHGLALGVSAALTWADLWAGGAQGQGSNVGQLINDANRIESRILTLNTDLDYRIRDGLGVGFGYRYQEFIDEAQLGPLDLDETVHTVMLRLKVDL